MRFHTLSRLCIVAAGLLLSLGSASAQRFHFLTVRTNDFVLENQGTNLFNANTNLLVAPLLNHFLTPAAAAGAYQPLAANLSTWAGVTPSANGQSLVSAANYATMKSLLALENVDNTSDANKPVSTATQAALDGKLSTTGNASGLTALNASQLASGTVPDARFPATLPAASGANLTALNASQLASGTVPDARFPATLPAASGANLTNIDGNDVTSTETPLTISNAGTWSPDGSSKFNKLILSGATWNIDLPAAPVGQLTIHAIADNTSGGSQVGTILVDGTPTSLRHRESGTDWGAITNAADTVAIEYSFTSTNGGWSMFSAPYVAVATGTSTVTNFTDLADVPSSYSGEGGKGVRVNAGETALEFYSLAGSSALASGEVLTTDNAATPVLTNAVAAGYSKYFEAYVLGTGPTNGWSGNAYLRLANRDGTGVGVSNATPSLVEGAGGAAAYWAAVGTNAVLYVQGADQENVSWSWEAWIRREHTNGLPTASSTTYLLDKITNIYTAFAGSMARKLTNTATVPFRIHRMSDATEQDASFTGDVLDTTSVSSFVSTGSARASKFYNQTGETAQDLLTTTTNLMPVVMIDGTLQTLGGFPALHLNIDNTSAYDDQLTTASTYNQNQPWTVYAVVAVEEATGTDRYFASFGSTSRGAMGADATGPRVLMTSGSILAGPGITTATMYLFRAVVNGGASEISLDGVAPTTGSAGANTMTRISLGQSSASLRSKVVEYIVILGKPSTDQDTLIVNDMMDYYNIGE